MKEYADLEGALRACTKNLLGPRELRIQSGKWVGREYTHRTDAAYIENIGVVVIALEKEHHRLQWYYSNQLI